MKDQYYPFNDFLSCTISGYGPDAEELPWREVVKRMRQYPRENTSKMLAHLTRVFRNELDHKGEIKALEKFWEEVKEMRDVGFLTDDMEKVLRNAKSGNIKAAQIMVRANPNTLHLPFIAKALQYVLSQHKFCDVKTKNGVKGMSILSEIKQLWKDFLPMRTGGHIPYNPNNLRIILLLAEKQMVRRNKLEVLESVAEALGVSVEYLQKRIKPKR